MKTTVSMPSNIALIKYMGKSNTEKNKPANHSLSITLPHLTSSCTVTLGEQEDAWVNHPDTVLTLPEQQKALKHISFLKSQLQIHEPITVSCFNKFPMSAGIASSASSMAAITEAVYQFSYTYLNLKRSLSKLERAQLSQRGSGSSCRSFFSPITVWKNEDIFSMDMPFKIEHDIILFSQNPKKTSSSKAHTIISQSSNLDARIERANNRVNQLIDALTQKNWETIVELSIEDSKDMHQLLESVGVNYRTEESHAFFKDLDVFCQSQPKFKPLTTMDAGCNIHIIYPIEQQQFFSDFLNHFKHYKTL